MVDEASDCGVIKLHQLDGGAVIGLQGEQIWAEKSTLWSSIIGGEGADRW